MGKQVITALIFQSIVFVSVCGCCARYKHVRSGVTICARVHGDLRVSDVFLYPHPPYCLETLSLNGPEAYHFWLIWLATENSGSAYCCPPLQGVTGTRSLCPAFYTRAVIRTQQVLRLAEQVPLSTGVQTRGAQSHLY